MNKTINSTHGYVYLIASSDGLVKIGYSKKPLERLSDLQTGSSSELRLIAEIETGNAARLEAKLHEEFGERRLRGEWFLLSESDIGRAIVMSHGIDQWIRRTNSEKLFTEDQVIMIVKKRLERERNKSAISQTRPGRSES